MSYADPRILTVHGLRSSGLCIRFHHQSLCLHNGLVIFRMESCARLQLTTATRSPALLDVPTIGETVPEPSSQLLVCTRRAAGDARGGRREMNRQINASLADPKLATRMGDLGAIPFPLGPEEFDGLSPRMQKVGQGRTVRGREDKLMRRRALITAV